jgi:TolA-binding protein
MECPNGHAVHPDPCLKQWFLTGKESQCPACREPYQGRPQKFFVECQKERELSEQKAKEMQRAAQASGDPATKEKEKVFQRVSSLVRQEQYESAINLLFDAQEKYPNDPNIAFLLGQTFFVQQKYGLAVNQLMKAVKIDFKQPMAFYYLTRCFIELDMHDKAIWAAERALVHFGTQTSEYREFCKNVAAQRFNPPPAPPKN